MAKINWALARNEYISDETQTYDSIAKKYGVSDVAVDKHARREGWVKLRQEQQAKVGEELAKKSVESLADVNARHVQTAKILQAKGMKVIIDPKLKLNSETARKFVDTGVKMERQALGLEKDTGAPSVNVFVAVSTDQEKYGF